MIFTRLSATRYLPESSKAHVIAVKDRMEYASARSNKRLLVKGETPHQGNKGFGRGKSDAELLKEGGFTPKSAHVR